MTASILRPFRETVGALREMEAIIIPVDMPSTGYALSAYYVLASAEASSCLARFDGIQYGVSLINRPFRVTYIDGIVRVERQTAAWG